MTWIYYMLCVHSSADGHLHGIWGRGGAFINKDVMEIHIKNLCGSRFLFLSGEQIRA